MFGVHASLQHFCPCSIKMSSFCVFFNNTWLPPPLSDKFYLRSKKFPLVFEVSMKSLSASRSSYKMLASERKISLVSTKANCPTNQVARSFWPFSLYQKKSLHLAILNFSFPPFLLQNVVFHCMPASPVDARPLNTQHFILFVQLEISRLQVSSHSLQVCYLR